LISSVKHLIGSLATPFTITLLLAAVAALFVLRGRRRSAAWLACSALLVLYFGSLLGVGEALLAPLEGAYLPLRADAPLENIDTIVVLGSSFTPRDSIPVTGALDADGLARIVEGVRLARRLPRVRLIVSGGAPPGHTPGALGYAELARDLGVDDASLVVLQWPLDTGAEARAVAALLKGAPFVLVTSAYHMRRAVRLMQGAGQQPIPAPTGQRVGGSPGIALHRWLPSSVGMHDTEIALHEYLGLAALAIGIT
jgi:uncharacterized SAM-binding protein YcdF (DUF218 family)